MDQTAKATEMTETLEKFKAERPAEYVAKVLEVSPPEGSAIGFRRGKTEKAVVRNFLKALKEFSKVARFDAVHMLGQRAFVAWFLVLLQNAVGAATK